MEGGVGLVGGPFTHISGQPQDSESSPVRDRRSTTVPRKTPMNMNRDAGSHQLSHTWDQVISRSRAPSSCKQSRRDQDVRRTSKRCH